MSRVEEFYAGKSVFITGATGFVGKCLTEKLLRSCADIETIYLLVRAKKGRSVQERIDYLANDSVFGVLRSENPGPFKKIVAVNGDIAEERLGLSDTDYKRLVDEVSVIFHVAATVRFNESLETAVAINVNGTKCIVDMAKECKKLDACVYVSTAFSNSHREEVDERVYPPWYSYEKITEIVKEAKMEDMSEKEKKEFTKRIIGKAPNTYIFTKAIAEGVIAEHAKDLPFCINRPPIVLNSYREPIPGWVYGRVGVGGLICAGGLGMMIAGLLDLDNRAQVAPVDFVCNSVICAAWETAIDKKTNWDPERIPVYNCVANSDNAINWGNLLDTAAIYGRMYPSKSAMYYQTVVFTKSLRLYNFLNIILNLIPARIFDAIRVISGRKPMAYQVSCIIAKTFRSVSYFSLHYIDYEHARLPKLWKRITPLDRAKFPFDMRTLDWDEHIMKMAKGLWTYMVGEPDNDGDTEIARRRQVYLYILHLIVCLFLGTLALWIISSVGNWLMEALF